MCIRDSALERATGQVYRKIDRDGPATRRTLQQTLSKAVRDHVSIDEVLAAGEASGLIVTSTPAGDAAQEWALK